MTEKPIKPLLILSPYAPSEHNRMWYDLQHRFIKKTTTVDFDFKIFLNGIPEDEFDPADVAGISATNDGHSAAMAWLLEYARQHPYRDYLFLDSDCFPIRKDWNLVLADQMQQMDKTIAAPVRVENLDLFPHPCAVFINGGEIHNKAIKFRNDKVITNMLGKEVSDVGTAMVDMDNILPLLRTNVVNVHPLAAAIYQHLFYHHGAGSRRLGFRITELYKYHVHWYQETARDTHGEQLLQTLNKNPDKFINRLLGQKEPMISKFLHDVDSKKVSFIIPVFNVEQFIPACLDSVVNQSVQDIEIICINDCSQDNSQKILESYAAKDSRIRLIKFDWNQGPGGARNAGLEEASGEYIRMVDGDDFIPLDSTAKMLQVAEEYNSNFVRGGFRACSQQGHILAKGWNYPSKLAVNTSIRDNRLLWGGDQHWAYLYRTQTLLATGVQYDESMRNGQDAAFITDLMPHLKQVTIIPETVYFYRNNPTSTTRRKRDKTFFLNILSLYARAYRRLETIDLKEAADYIFYFALCNYLSQKIFPTIPEELQYEDAEEILIYLKQLFKEYETKNLCFTNRYSWQKKSKIPLEIKYLILLLQDHDLTEAYNTLNSERIRTDKEQRLQKQIKQFQYKLNSIQYSTSWRITAPIRYLVDKAKNSFANR